MADSHPIWRRPQVTLWVRLHDARLAEFYDHLLLAPETTGEDWQPMADLVRMLRTLEGAIRLFGFISKRRLYVTTASRYVDSAGHHSVSIAWQPHLKFWCLGYGSLDHGLGTEADEEVSAPEETMPPTLQRMLQRLLAEP